MNFRLSKSIASLLALFLFAGFHSSEAASPKKNKKNVVIPEATIASYPTTDVLLPLAKLAEYPFAGTLNKLDSPKKQITTDFSAREMNHVGVKDAERFKESQTEIIDLTQIQEGDYAFPLPNAKVISPYGGRRKHHSGYDLKTCPNDTIVAAFDGVVRMAKPYAAYGNVVVIRHYNGLETVYSHNSKNLVKPGDVVKAGTPIALTGRTGRATTAHLHFEVRINGVHFNPNYVFNFKKQELKRECLICRNHGNRITVKPVRALPLYLLNEKNQEK